LFGHLDHEKIKISIGGQSLNEHFHNFDRAHRPDVDLASGVLQNPTGNPFEGNMSKSTHFSVAGGVGVAVGDETWASAGPQLSAAIANIANGMLALFFH
jgi:hypothetical protein